VLGEHQILITLAILAVLAAVFVKGFNEAIGLATAAALPYLALNLVVLGRGAWEVIAHPALLADWRSALAAKGNVPLLIAGAVLVFPKLALGLSGFETSTVAGGLHSVTLCVIARRDLGPCAHRSH
jgi:hypothetical protein